MSCRALFRIVLAISAVAFVVGCTEYQTPPPKAVAPAPTPAGYWNGDGVPGSPKIVVSISEQHAYFYKGKNLVGESTVSTGKAGFGTPPGHYTVLSKDPTHVSTVFGDYVDEFGNVVKSNIDVRKDSKPAGSHYDGARMPYAMFFRGGYAMHQGYVPPYAASHGCIRIPREMAETFFDNAPVGTPVIVKEEAVMRSAPVQAINPAPGPTAPVVVRPTTALASARPAPVRSTVPPPAPVSVRSPAPVLSRASVPVRSPAPAPAPSRTHRRVHSRARAHVPAPSPTPTP